MQRGHWLVLSGLAVLLVILCCGCTGVPPAAGPMNTPCPTPPPLPPLPYQFHSLVEGQQALLPGAVLFLPSYLPDEFVFSDGTQARCIGVDPGNDGEVILRYSRGEDIIVLRQFPSGREPCPGEIGCPANRTGKIPVYSGNGRQNTLQWEDAGLCFFLQGPFPGDVLRRIASSVSPAPYNANRTPPYDYVPPSNPLERFISVNRSVTTGNVTVTVESVACTREACMVTLRTTLSSPPAVSPPPGGMAAPVAPDPHGTWRVDGGRPLLAVQAVGYRPEGDETVIFWPLEPVPASSSRLSMNLTRFRQVQGPWVLEVPLNC